MADVAPALPRYDLAAFDEALGPEPEPRPSRPVGDPGGGTRIADGTRNATLYAQARSMHARGFSVDAIGAALAIENETRCDPPLDAEEIAGIAAHAAAQPDAADFDPAPGPRAIVGGPAPDAPIDPAAPFELSAADLLARTRTAPALAMAIEGLVPAEGITLFHAQPRALKTWLALECGLALATGTAALGCLAVPRALPVLYITNEDGWRVGGRRLDGLLRGRGLTTIPEPFGFAIHAGVWLDDPAWQARLTARIRAVGYRALILDPLRSLTACVDQGPRELQPLTRFLRQLVDDTGVIPLLAHHDTKPLLGQRETRQRPQRVSGGGLFSIADSPIHCERVGDDQPAVALVVPSLWKLCEAPSAHQVSLTVDADGARLTATPLAATGGADHAAADAQILAVLRTCAEASTRTLIAAVHLRADTVRARLAHLADAGTVASRKGGRNAVLWKLAPVPTGGDDAA